MNLKGSWKKRALSTGNCANHSTENLVCIIYIKTLFYGLSTAAIQAVTRTQLNSIIMRTLTEHKLRNCRSQWPHSLRRRSTAARLQRSWVRVPPRAWMFVCFECCVLSGRGLCDGVIIRSEESYWLWRVVVFDHETSQARRLKPARGL